LSKHEQSLLEADINECLTTINRSIPARLMVPVLLKSTPALLNCGHAGTLRYALFLSNLWSSLDRKAVLGSLTDNSAICAMIMDYRRAYIVSKQSHLSEEVEGEIANCIVQFGLKLTETELNKLIARLGEWRDSLSITSSIADNNKGTESSVDLKAKNVYARSISFYKLMSQFGRKLKSIFVPSYASVWSHCIDVLKHCSSVHTKSVSLLVKANNKNNGAIANKDGKKGKDKVNKRKRDNDNNDDEDEVMLSLNGGDLGEMILSTKSVLDAVRVCCTYDNNEFVDESRYEATMPVVANLLTSTYPFEHLKKLNDRGEENNSSESDTESDSDSDGDSDDDEANNKKHSKTSKYRQEDGGYMNFILQYVSPCLVSLALCVGKDVLWKPLNHHVLMATRNPAPMVRMAALKTLQTLFAEVGEEYLILLPECLPFLSELMEDDSSDVIDLTSEIIRYIEELSGEKLTQYLQ
jgi:U3 small nucleolar RNA-associated protein 10